MAWIREEEIQAPAIRRVMSIIPSAMEAIGNGQPRHHLRRLNAHAGAGGVHSRHGLQWSTGVNGESCLTEGSSVSIPMTQSLPAT